MGGWLAVLGWLAGGLVVVAVVAPYLLRPPAPTLPDPYAPVPDEVNAWPPLQDLCDQIRPPLSRERYEELRARLAAQARAGSHRRLTPEQRAAARDSSVLGELLGHADGPLPGHGLDEVAADSARGAALLDAVDAALARPALVLPRPGDDPLWDANATRRALALVDLADLRARRLAARLRAGDLAAAASDLLRALELSDRVTVTGQPHSVLFAFSTARLACQALLAGLGPRPAGATGDPTVAWPSSGWSLEAQDLWRPILERLLADDAPDRVAAVLAAEFWGSGVWQSYRTARRHPPAVLFDARRTRWREELWVREVISQTALPRRQRQLSGLAQVCREPWWLRWYNPVGQGLLATATQIPPLVVGLHDRALDQRRLTGLVLAAKLFTERHGRLARAWSEMVEDGLLPAIPMDPYDGRPVRYDPWQGAIYYAGKRWGDQDLGTRWNLLRHVPPDQRQAMESPAGLDRCYARVYQVLAWVADEQQVAAALGPPWRSEQPYHDDSPWWREFTHRAMGAYPDEIEGPIS